MPCLCAEDERLGSDEARRERPCPAARDGPGSWELGLLSMSWSSCPWGPMCPFLPSSLASLSRLPAVHLSLSPPCCLPMFRSLRASYSGTLGFSRPPCPDASLSAHTSPGMGALRAGLVAALSTVVPPRLGSAWPGGPQGTQAGWAGELRQVGLPGLGHLA